MKEDASIWEGRGSERFAIIVYYFRLIIILSFFRIYGLRPVGLFQFSVVYCNYESLDIWYDSLDGRSAHRKASTYTAQ
jgi:hypothetical protein